MNCRSIVARYYISKSQFFNFRKTSQTRFNLYVCSFNTIQFEGTEDTSVLIPSRIH